jgi:hypothetical protein
MTTMMSDIVLKKKDLIFETDLIRIECNVECNTM